MQMIRRLLLFAGIVKVTSRWFAAPQDYGQRLVINLDVLPVPGTRRVVIVVMGFIISGGIRGTGRSERFDHEYLTES